MTVLEEHCKIRKVTKQDYGAFNQWHLQSKEACCWI